MGTAFFTKNLSVGYDRRQSIVRNLNIKIRCGEICVLLGPNGSGKTTFIKTIAGIIPAHSGEYAIGKEEKISFVPQSKKMKLEFPLTVQDILTMNGEIGLASFQRKTFLKYENEILEKIGIRHILNQLIGECSGGQLQKVLIVRSLFSPGSLIFLDEPLDALDEDSRKVIPEIMKTQSRELHRTFFVITHDLDNVGLKSFDRVFRIQNQTIVEKRIQ